MNEDRNFDIQDENEVQQTQPSADSVAAIRKLLAHKYVILLIFVTLASIAGGAIILLTSTKPTINSQQTDAETEELRQSQKIEINNSDYSVFTNRIYSGALTHSPGLVWVANGHGLLSYNAESKETKVYTEADGLWSSSTEDVEYFDNSIWVISPDEGVNHPPGVSRLNLEDNSWTTYSADEYGFGWLRAAYFTVEDEKLIITGSDSPGDNVITSVFDPVTQKWDVSSVPGDRIKSTFSEDDWGNFIDSIDGQLSINAQRLYENSCKVEELLGVRLDQQVSDPLYGGLSADADGKVWLGCLEGFIVVDLAQDSAEYIDLSDGNPTIVYDILAAKDDLVVAHTNVGLGILKPATGEWIEIRSNIFSNLGQLYDVWNSAVWIENKIYFMEVKISGSSNLVSSTRDSRLWLYDLDDSSLRDVTPDPEDSIQDAYFRVPKVLQKSSDGKTLIYMSNYIIYAWTPSVPNPGAAVFDFATEENPIAKKYWGYDEQDGTIWYLTEQYLGRTVLVSRDDLEDINDPGPGSERIDLPEGFDRERSSCVDANANYVIIHGGKLTDKQLFIYDISAGTWSNDVLEELQIRSLSCAENSVVINDGKFKDYIISDGSTEFLQEISSDTNQDIVSRGTNKSQLLAISLVNKSPKDLGEQINFPNSSFSQIVKSNDAIWVRHGLTGYSKISNE